MLAGFKKMASVELLIARKPPASAIDRGVSSSPWLYPISGASELGSALTVLENASAKITALDSRKLDVRSLQWR
jgi:hypothetical protein